MLLETFQSSSEHCARYEFKIRFFFLENFLCRSSNFAFLHFLNLLCLAEAGVFYNFSNYTVQKRFCPMMKNVSDVFLDVEFKYVSRISPSPHLSLQVKVLESSAPGP
jgi:hypothetical protein